MATGGDGLYSNQPFIDALKANAMSFVGAWAPSTCLFDPDLPRPRYWCRNRDRFLVPEYRSVRIAFDEHTVLNIFRVKYIKHSSCPSING